MRKQLLAIGLFTLVFATATQAQNAVKEEKEEFVKKEKGGEDLIQQGVNTVNIYYGVSLLNSIYKNLAEDGNTDLKLTSLGPIGVVYEHLMTDVIGLGAEVGYSSLNMSYYVQGQNPNTGALQNYKSTWKFSTFRAMLRVNFHFAHSEHFDAYGLVSAGYRNSTYSFSSEDPNYTGKTTFGGIIPFGIKPGLGLRYFFTENIGLNVEIAIGTPVLCGGLSFKF